MEWNDTARRATRATPASTSSSRRRRRARPDAVGRGVRAAQRSPTRELDARANRLAHHLRALGVGPEVARGRSAWSARSELVVGAAGHPQGRRRLRAARPGAIPRERLAFMLEDARRAGAAHARARCAARCRRGRGAACCLDADARGRRAPRAPAPAARRRAEQPRLRHLHLGLARARPRACWCTHRRAGATSLGGHARGVRRRRGRRDAGARARSPSTSRRCELWLPLLHGGRAGASWRERAPALDALGARWRRARRHARCTLTAGAAAASWWTRERGRRCARLRRCSCGGEALSAPTLLARAARGCPRRGCCNLLRPHRDARVCVHGTAGAGGRRARPCPIGRPHRRTRASTCWTRRGSRCRSGVPGELYIGGDGRGARLPGPARS